MVGKQSMSHRGLWLGVDCRQLMQVKSAALTPCAEHLASGQGKDLYPCRAADCPVNFPTSLPHFSPCLIFFLHYSFHVISMISFEGNCPDTAPHCLFILIFPTCFFCPPFHLHVLQSIKTKRKKSFRLSRKFPFYKSKENLAQESSGQERK